jgi:hypothetical protein
MRDGRPAWVAAGVALLIVTVLLWWPGLLSSPVLPPRCNPSGVPNETVAGRTYCVAPSSLAERECYNGTALPDQSVSRTLFLGFAFGTSWAGGDPCTLGGALNITVIDPSGQVYHGIVFLGGPARSPYELWIAPNNQSGFDSRGGFPVVMVSVGS